jgi:phage regulator Rha-like protein
MIAINESIISNKIYVVRNQKVMLDRDLAALYEVETKRLKEAVKRNIDRFPDDFMFEMTNEELEFWRSQFVTSNADKSVSKGLRYKPFCFTEQGVAMLSSVLASERAIKVNIQIIRIFTKMREMLFTQKDILLKLEKLERNSDKHDFEITHLFNAIKSLLMEPEKERMPIGFKQHQSNK